VIQVLDTERTRYGLSHSLVTKLRGKTATQNTTCQSYEQDGLLDLPSRLVQMPWAWTFQFERFTLLTSGSSILKDHVHYCIVGHVGALFRRTLQNETDEPDWKGIATPLGTGSDTQK
jgi:hypothetical protein